MITQAEVDDLMRRHAKAVRLYSRFITSTPGTITRERYLRNYMAAEQKFSRAVMTIANRREHESTAD